MPSLTSESLFPTTRLEAFSDGVIAVIITIMVLELKVPEDHGIAGLLKVAPVLFVYLLSFSFTAIYWVNHHHLIRRVEACDHRVLYANLAFLFCASLLPFFTSYVIDKKADSFSVALYAASMVVCGFSFLLLRLSVSRLLRMAGTLEEEDVMTKRKHYASLAVYLLAIPIAFYQSYIALGLIASLTLVWIYPTAHVQSRPGDNPNHINPA